MEPGLWSKTAALCPGGPALLLWVSTLSCSVSSLTSPSSSLVPQLRTSYNSGRTFLGLDKCNACIGTSICKKFFKEEIRFDIQLASRLGLPPDYLPSYPANYSDDSKTWRPVELLRLVGKQQSEISDRRICASAAAPNTCSIERILRKTGRFQKWLQAKRLTPDLVQTDPPCSGPATCLLPFTGWPHLVWRHGKGPYETSSALRQICAQEQREVPGKSKERYTRNCFRRPWKSITNACLYCC